VLSARIVVPDEGVAEGEAQGHRGASREVAAVASANATPWQDDERGRIARAQRGL
jgi:hypothetical protein